MTFTARELQEAAEREVRLRRRVYANRVETGRMHAREADRQIAMMEAIAAVLKERADAEEARWSLPV